MYMASSLVLSVNKGIYLITIITVEKHSYSSTLSFMFDYICTHSLQCTCVMLQ